MVCFSYQDNEHLLDYEYQSGYVNGWLQAEHSRPIRKKILLSAGFAAGIVFGHILTLFL